MSDSAQTGAGEDEVVVDAGSSADQHVTGAAETGTFLEDTAPTADTPAHGSSNAGINAADPGRADASDDPTGSASLG